HGVGELAQNALERIGILRERRAGVIADIALVVVEKRVFHFARQPIRKAFGHLGSGRRWRRRRSDGHQGWFVQRSAGSGGGEPIRGGFVGKHAASAGCLNGADPVVNRDLSGVRDRPLQRGRLTSLDGRRFRRKLRNIRCGRWWRSRRRRCGRRRWWWRRRFFLTPRRSERD